ncbi:hypothetical protein BGW80DRAFT_850444 [Lactifluus volemus]|nr:hypothetical protein BGW80DRAFT_850444 [Lactifluus volemus]
MSPPGPNNEALPEDVLLDIFYFYQRDSYGYVPNQWHILVHVCRRWRYAVFGFPRRLDLYLECNTNIPVRRTLDIWPSLPIMVKDTQTRKLPALFGDSIVAALERHDRVCEIKLNFLTCPELKQFLGVIQVPFPALTYLKLDFGDKSVPPPVLDAFLGGSAPRLQRLILGGIPVPALPKLIPSCHDLVQVQLTRIPHTGYISPEAMATSLSALAMLEVLHIEFESPASRPHRHRLPSTRVILPALTRFEFHGDIGYIEDLVSRIDTPSISSVETKFFNRLIFDTPQFLEFVGRTNVLGSFKRAELFLDKSTAEISLSNDRLHPPVNPEANLHILISCDALDWQLSGLAQICEQFSIFLSNVEECNMGWTQKRLEDDMDDTQWLELFRPFTSVQGLKLLSGLDSLIAPALNELTGDWVMEVLPALRTLSVTTPNVLLTPFITARQLSNHPVILIPLLFDHDAALNAVGENGQTPLHVASRMGYLDVVRALLDRGADVNAQENNKQTPLHLASREGHFKVACVLLEYDADPNSLDASDLSPLHCASQAGHLEVSQVLLEEMADPNSPDEKNQTPLHLASQSGRLEVARVLLENLADVNAKDVNQQTPLHLVLQGHQMIPFHGLSQYQHLEVAQLLLKSGADANAQDENKRTPLHSASQEGFLDILRILVEHGGDINSRDNDNRTPLHLASEGCADIARFLLNGGADANAQDKNKRTPLHSASQGGFLDVLRILFEHGGDINSQDNDNRTPLHLASEGCADIARFLLEKGADVRCQDNSLWTPLHVATQAGDLEVVRALLDHKADPNTLDDEDRNALHVAFQGGHVELMVLLFDCGTHVQNEKGPSSFQEVFSENHHDIVVDWLEHVTDSFEVAGGNSRHDVTHTSSLTERAERVLSVIAQVWSLLSKKAQQDVVKILSSKSCIPTSSGLKVPGHAYFPGVRLFPNFPIVTMPSGSVIKGSLRRVLESIGVRKSATLQIFVDRMIKTENWTNFDLVKYLVSIQPVLSPMEIKRLQKTTAFTLEGSEEGQPTPDQKIQRYKAMDLYEPVEIFRELGLPVMDWGVKNEWKRSSDEGKLLLALGVRCALSLSDILTIAASDNLTARDWALNYFLGNLSTRYSEYDPHNYRDLAFVPAVVGSMRVLAKPFEVYADPQWAALGFPVVDPMLPEGAARKLKLGSYPSSSDLVALLEEFPPEDEMKARQWFEILSGYEFSQADKSRLTKIPFIPVESAGDNGEIRRMQPIQCHFPAGGAEFYSKLFVFVDFGPRANTFLASCGTKQPPSIDGIAKILLADPKKFYELAGSPENYILELRKFAMNQYLLSIGTINRMKESDVLLGSRRRVKSSEAPNEGGEDNTDIEYKLLQPKEIVIADDKIAYQVFGDRIFCAPQEDLEELYHVLGSPYLSSLVREDYKKSGEIPSSPMGTKTRDLILERLPLFLRECPQSRTKISFDWLNNEKNFVVTVFRKVLITRSLHHGDIHCSKSQEASVVADRQGKGPIELWLAENKEVHMYEVSTSLRRFILVSPTVNDTNLFMTILSMDREALKQRGYNVDRVQRRNPKGKAPEVPMETSSPQVSGSGRDMVKAQVPRTKISLAPTGGAMDPALANTDREQISRRPTNVVNEPKRLLRANPGNPEIEEPPPAYSRN